MHKDRIDYKDAIKFLRKKENTIIEMEEVELKSLIKLDEKKEFKILNLVHIIEDLTLPNKIEVIAGENFTKVWKVINAGNQSWEEGVFLLYLEGSQEFGLLSNSTFNVPRANAKEEVDIQLTLTAPKVQGVYEANFRLCTKYGEEFGDKLNLKVDVIEKKVANQMGTVIKF